MPRSVKQSNRGLRTSARHGIIVAWPPAGQDSIPLKTLRNGELRSADRIRWCRGSGIHPVYFSGGQATGPVWTGLGAYRGTRSTTMRSSTRCPFSMTVSLSSMTVQSRIGTS